MPQSETPARMSLTDLDTNESITVMFNPQELNRRIAVNYAKTAVLGNSHMEHEYLQTDNQQITFDLFHLVETPDDREAADIKLAFLESLAYPEADVDTIAQGTPPRVLMVWPRTLSLVVRLMSLDVKYQRWNRYGNTTQFVAACTFEESRTTRLGKTNVRLNGALRATLTQGKLDE